jgi:predicted CoA-binding protein
MPVVAVVGASSDRTKFGNKALRAYLRKGWDVRPVHPRESEIEGLPVVPSLRELGGPVDRVTLYVPPAVGITMLESVAELAPGEFWVNPGAESPELIQQAQELGLEPIIGCAILDIGESPAVL